MTKKDSSTRQSRFLAWAEDVIGAKPATFSALFDELILHFQEDKDRIAGTLWIKMHSHVPFVDLDDFKSVGTLGLIAALNHYDPAKGKFETYLYSRVKSAIFEDLSAFIVYRHFKSRFLKDAAHLVQRPEWIRYEVPANEKQQTLSEMQV